MSHHAGKSHHDERTHSSDRRPITDVQPSAQFWGINQEIQYGTITIFSETAGIVDAGTTLTLIAKIEDYTEPLCDQGCLTGTA